MPGGTDTQSADYATTFELPENVPIRESELRAVELLLGSALRDFWAQDADYARKDGGEELIDNEPQSAAQ